MVINHNLTALNAQRNMGINNSAATKSMEKLSSGLKINRAGDNAAGLSISEKMRGQIRGLNQASTNAQDGISMIQTAEGALNETHSILQRMRELANQAANGTNADSDKKAIQEEMNQLSSEVNRIGNTTEFNTQKLLNGEKSNEVKVETKPVAGTTTTPAVAGKYSLTMTTDFADGDTIAIGGTTFTAKTTPASGSTTEFSVANKFEDLATLINNDSSNKFTATVSSDKKTLTLTQKSASTVAADTYSDRTGVAAGGTGTGKYTSAVDTAAADAVTTAGTPGVFSFKFDPKTKSDVKINGTDTFAFDKNATGTDGKFKDADTLVTAINAKYATNGYTAAKVTNSDGTTSIKLTQKGTEVGKKDTPKVTGASDNSVKLQIGANENQSMSISIKDMRSEALGLTSKAGGEGFTANTVVTDGTNSETVEHALDVTSYDNAKAAITTIQNALDSVSAERSGLGAYQNRLEHTINNLGTSSENLTSAESRIRDTDMASEMSEYSKNNILQQAAQAMLAQAKSAPQSVLQLLQ